MTAGFRARTSSVAGQATPDATLRTWTSEDFRTAFARWQTTEPEHAAVLDAEALAYVDYHAVRYARLLTYVARLAAAARPPDRLHILDVAPNVETALLRAAHPDAIVDSLGFAHPGVPAGPGECHFEFDLNDVPVPERRPEPARLYDVVVMAEIVEHLHISLSTLLSWLSGWLRPPGFILIQTPNAAALHKRIRLLLGRNPVEPPRDCPENPGHFHEYTLAELHEQVSAAGLMVDWLEVDNHFGGTAATARAWRAFGHLLPPALKHGVTLCARAAP